MRALLFAVVAVVLLLTGCGPVDVATPASLSVNVTQGRTDRDARIIVMDVTNTGDSPIRLTRSELDTPQFVDAAVWSRGTTLGPGLTVSLRAPLSDPVCPIAADAEPTVTLDYETEDGAGSLTVAPTQSTGVLAIIGRDDCVAVLAAEHADIRVADTVAWTPGAHQPASLDIIVTPTDADGELDLVTLRSTILLGLIDSNGEKVDEIPLSLTIDKNSREQRITLQLVPNRCDPHAVAEDKRGTIMVLDVQTRDAETGDGVAGTAYYRSSDDVKASLYAFVTDYCS